MSTDLMIKAHVKQYLDLEDVASNSKFVFPFLLFIYAFSPPLSFYACHICLVR